MSEVYERLSPDGAADRLPGFIKRSPYHGKAKIQDASLSELTPTPNVPKWQTANTGKAEMNRVLIPNIMGAFSPTSGPSKSRLVAFALKKLWKSGHHRYRSLFRLRHQLPKVRISQQGILFQYDYANVVAN